jgi:thiol-disulfide isomerase/thioredoxin
VVVLFSARWCVPAISLAPEFERLAKQTSNAVFVSIDADRCPKLLDRFQVSTLPHIVIGGSEGWREINATTSEELRLRVERLVASRTKPKTRGR